MKIEEEIKQTKFTNEFHKLTINILFTANWINSINSKFLKEYDLTPQQFNILRILRGRRPATITVNSLQERMLDRMSNASRLVEKLRQKGLVSRNECGADRRMVDVTITENGLSLLSEIDQKFPVIEKEFENISVEDAQKLNDLLDNFRK